MLIELDLTSDIPLYQQIRDQIVLGLAAGRLRDGESMPSVRQLASDLGINFMTVNKAYGLLKQEGYLVTDRRAGSRLTLPRGNEDIPGPVYWDKVSLLLAEGLSQSGDTKKFREKLLSILAELEERRR